MTDRIELAKKIGNLRARVSILRFHADAVSQMHKSTDTISQLTSIKWSNETLTEIEKIMKIIDQLSNEIYKI